MSSLMNENVGRSENKAPISGIIKISAYFDAR